MKDLTVIMPFLNESMEPINTINSIRETSKDIEIIAIDDCSAKQFRPKIKSEKGLTCIRNKKRLGVGASRQLGVQLAKTENILIIDAHMRFNNGWSEKMVDLLNENVRCIYCTTCLSLGYGNMDLKKAKSRYYGATLQVFNKDANPDRPARDILEAKWIPKKKDGTYEIPCVLGANYFFTKTWFNHIGGFNGLRLWGSSEPFLSMKSYLAGGSCQITTDIEIGHQFRDRAPYTTLVSNLVYNKLFIMETLFPKELQNAVEPLMPNTRSFRKAKDEVKKAQEEIQKQRNYFDRFHIETP